MTVTNNQAWEIPKFLVGQLEANVDMSDEALWQYVGVSVGAASGAGLLGPSALVAPAAGGAILGVLQSNPKLAEVGTVMESGISKAKLAANVTAGALLMVNGAGKFLPATGGNFAVAQALQAGSTGAVVSVLVKNFGKQ
jgi:hypothetical protein